MGRSIPGLPRRDRSFYQGKQLFICKELGRLGALQHPGIRSRDTMRGKSCPLALCAIAIAMTVSTAVRAQNTAACVVTGFSAMVYSGGTWGHAPFSATVRTTLDQKLADGNAIHGSATTHQARDSAGRTMLEVSSGCVPDQDGHDRPIVRVTVNDLGLAMVAIHDDPRSGRRTTEVEELNFSEPSPSLFIPPSGYKMEEQVMKSVSAAGAQ
jgi:hypothetical protein